jgi:hypothetical protein
MKDYKNLKKSIMWQKFLQDSLGILDGVGEASWWTGLQHCAIKNNFTFGITIVIRV